MIFFTTAAIIIFAGAPATMVAAGIHVMKLIRKIDRRVVQHDVQQEAMQVLMELDHPSDSNTPPQATVLGNPPDQIQTVRKKRRTYASKLAVMCEMAIPGVTKKTEANKAVIAHFVSRQMKLDNVRICDQREILLATTLFVFTPSAIDVHYRRLEQSAAIIDREVAGNRQYRTIRSWRDWFSLRFKSRSDPVLRA